MSQPPAALHVLVLGAAPAALRAAATQLGAQLTTVASAPEALAVLWSRGADVVTIEAQPPNRALAVLERFRGSAEAHRPRVVLLVKALPVATELTAGPIDLVLLAGAPAEAHAAALAGGSDEPMAPDQWLSLVGSGIMAAQADSGYGRLEKALARVFDADRGVLLPPGGRDEHGEADADTPWSAMRQRLSLAAAGGAAVLAPVIRQRADAGDQATSSYLAAHLGPGTSGSPGLFGLVTHRARPFSPSESAALRVIALRVGAELRWERAHRRVVSDLDRIRNAPRIDPSLSLWNRAALERLTAAQLAACERGEMPLSAMMFDVEGMGQINRRHGLEGGDAVIARVAATVLGEVRAEDLVGRYGGDEIVVIALGLDAAKAERLAERVQQAVSRQPLDLKDGARVRVAVTAAVATSSSGREQADRLLTRLARAVRTARDRGEPLRVLDTVPGAEERPSSTTLGRDGVEGQLTLGGTYRLLHEISRGGMGVVYRGEDIRLGRPVAIKMLRPDLAKDEALVSRFHAEAEILAQLEHPNLVRIYSFGAHRDDTYFAMELVEGESLQGAIERCRRELRLMPLAGLRAVAEQVGAALDALHQRGIVHRDVKPANVLIDPFRGRAVLVDVGIARRHGDVALPAGTPGFVPPEVLAGDEASAVSDVYGMAATFYTALTLQMPWGEPDDIRQLIARQTKQPPPPPSRHRPELGPADELLTRALCCDPSARPQTAGEFGAALSAALATITERVRRCRVESRIERRGARAGEQRTPAAPGPSPNAAGASDRVAPVSTASAAAAEAGAALGSAHHCRAIVLRAATSVLGVRQAQRLEHELRGRNPALAAAMSAQTAPLEWVSAARFHELLAEAARLGHQPAAFAHSLGRATVRLSFRRLFPVAAATLVPSHTLAALDVIWSRYHDWGALQPVPAAGRRLLVRFDGSPARAEVCAFIEGLLEQLVIMSGGTVASLEHLECLAAGGQACAFRVAWSVPSAA